MSSSTKLRWELNIAQGESGNMGCECKELEESSGTHGLIYTLGTEAMFYRMIQATLPKEPGPYGRPHVGRDGSLTFPDGEVPDILGYKRIGPRSFRPAWPSCRWRALLVTYPNGYPVIRGECHCTPAEKDNVVPQECKTCKWRAPILKRHE